MTTSPVAIITGAGSGIGRQTAILLAERGWRLVLAGRRRGALEETAAMLDGESLVACADVADPAQAAGLVDAALAGFGRLDALVNNAGWAPLAPIDRSDAPFTAAVFAVNAFGPGAAIARAWPVFVAQRSGRIVNLSTLGTADPFPGFFAYAAAKSAAESMVRSCAVEGRDHGIRAFAIAPGAVETDMLRANFSEAALPASKCLSAGAVAGVIVACLAGERDHDNGKVIYLPGP